MAGNLARLESSISAGSPATLLFLWERVRLPVPLLKKILSFGLEGFSWAV
jgi:hypothetical protein